MKKIILLVFLLIVTETAAIIAQQLKVEPAKLEFGSATNDSTFIVKKTENGILSWNITIETKSGEEGWITVDPQEGNTNKDMTVTVTVVRKNLTAGPHDGKVIVTSTTIPIQKDTVTVTVQVNPKLNVSPESLYFGPNTTESTFTITNSDSGILEWSIIIPDSCKDWISVDPEAGRTGIKPDFDIIRVSVDRSMFDVNGEQVGTVNVKSSGGTTGDTIVAVTVTMEVVPEIYVNTNSLNFHYTLTKKSFEIKNVGYGTLNWDIKDLQKLKDWIIKVEPDSGNLGHEETNIVSVAVSRDTLVGDYSDVLKITSDGGYKEVNVSMRVPIISSNPDSLHFNVNIDSQTFSIVNIDTNRDASGSKIVTANWKIQPDLATTWFKGVDKKSGSIISRDSTQVTVTVKKDSLKAKRYFGKLFIITNANDTYPNDTALVKLSMDVPNYPPIVRENAIPQVISLTHGAPVYQKNLNQVFWDPNLDNLSYFAYSSDTSVADAQVSADSFIIVTLTNPDIGDTSMIMVFAKDADTSWVATHFTVNVIKNSQPGLRHSIPDTILTVGGSTFHVNLNTVFFDLDGQKLAYSPKSSDSLVAMVSISSDSFLVVSLNAPDPNDTAKITIKADDGNGGACFTDFTVTANFPPRMIHSIQDLILTLGVDSVYQQNLSDIFFDPDSNSLTYQPKTSNESVTIEIEKSESLQILNAQLNDLSKSGDTTIVTIIADDKVGGQGSTAFKVIVNMPPTKKEENFKNLNNTLLTAANPSVRIPLDSLIFDPDGDQLYFSTKSNNESAAITYISTDSMLVVSLKEQAHDGDSAWITVGATDNKGGSISDSFTVTVAIAPIFKVLSYEPSKPQRGEDLKIKATITDDQGIDSVIIKYRKAGDSIWISAAKNYNNNDDTVHCEFTIPDTMVSDRGVEYSISAIDVHQLRTVMPSDTNYSSIPVFIPYPGIKKYINVYGSEQNSYRLISIPLDLDKKNPSDIFEDDLGKYDNTKWRLYELDSTLPYVEFPNTDYIAPGKSYWLIVKKPKEFGTGAGNTNSTSDLYPIVLHGGWNFIGNPFNFNIPIKNLKFFESKKDPVMRYFNGVWNNPDSINVQEMVPFEGYALFSEKAEDYLLVNPDLSSKSFSLSKEMISSSDDNAILKIHIRARCQEASDIDNIASVIGTASSGWDEMDRPEPPIIGEYVSVYFPHPEWGGFTSKYCVDSRPEPIDGDIWEFEVKTNIHDKVKLFFNGIENVPINYDVWLVDEALKITEDLRKTREYFVAGPSEDNPKRLKLMVGNASFIKDQIAEFELTPDTYELSQNCPNPFNPTTTIRYGLPAEGNVSLKVYNVYGQEVATLIDNEAIEAGYHIAIWDGRNVNGDKVTSGIYLYRFQSGDFIQIKKMALVK